MGPSFLGAVQTLAAGHPARGGHERRHRAAVAVDQRRVGGIAVTVILLRAIWQTTRAAALLDRALDRATRPKASCRSPPPCRSTPAALPAAAGHRGAARRRPHSSLIIMASAAVGGVLDRSGRGRAAGRWRRAAAAPRDAGRERAHGAERRRHHRQHRRRVRRRRADRPHPPVPAADGARRAARLRAAPPPRAAASSACRFRSTAPPTSCWRSTATTSWPTRATIASAASTGRPDG